MNEKPPIPWVELVDLYHESKPGGLYGTQDQRLRLIHSYIKHPEKLAGQFFRSVDQFGSYRNTSEGFVGDTRTPKDVRTTEEISNGPEAAAYLDRTLPNRLLHIEDVGDYVYVDREIEPARTTKKSRTMANYFDDSETSPSTRAISADLLLRSLPESRPAIGEVKVSKLTGHDADPVKALVQALALASQLVGHKQRERLHAHYPNEGFADEGPLDVVVMLFLLGDPGGTNREELVESTRQVCRSLDQGALLPHVERVALIEAKPKERAIGFSAVRPPS